MEWWKVVVAVVVERWWIPTARRSTGVPQPPSATTEGGEGICEEVHRGSTDSTEGFATGSPHREGGERVCRWGEPPGRSSGRGSEGGAE